MFSVTKHEPARTRALFYIENTSFVQLNTGQLRNKKMHFAYLFDQK